MLSNLFLFLQAAHFVVSFILKMDSDQEQAISELLSASSDDEDERNNQKGKAQSKRSRDTSNETYEHLSIEQLIADSEKLLNSAGSRLNLPDIDISDDASNSDAEKDEDNPLPSPKKSALRTWSRPTSPFTRKDSEENPLDENSSDDAEDILNSIVGSNNKHKIKENNPLSLTKISSVSAKEEKQPKSPQRCEICEKEFTGKNVANQSITHYIQYI